MFGYNHPNLKELLAYPALTVFVSLAITGNVPAGEWRELAKFGYVAICINSAIVPSVYLIKQFQEYMQNGADDTQTPANAPKNDRPIQADPQAIPRSMAGGMLVNSQSVEVVSVNAVRAFNKHLVTQYMGKLPIKMTENYWTKKEDGMEQTRWVKIGGTGPTDWKDMMARGVEWGAYKTEGGQEKRVIGSIRKVIQLSEGYPLPTWNQLKKM
jgi:hypothetical protein